MPANRIHTQGNSHSWRFHSGSKAQSSLGGAFETTRSICRIALLPAATLIAFVAASVCAAFLIILAITAFHGAI